MKNHLRIYNEIKTAFLDKTFLKELNMKRKEMESCLLEARWIDMAEELAESTDEQGRFPAKMVLEACEHYIDELQPVPEQGWLAHCYRYVLSQLFPEMGEPEGAAEYRQGRRGEAQDGKGIFPQEDGG